MQTFSAYVIKPTNRAVRPVDWPLDAPTPDEHGGTVLTMHWTMLLAFQEAGYLVWCPTCGDWPDLCPDMKEARRQALHEIENPACITDGFGTNSLPAVALVQLGPTRHW